MKDYSELKRLSDAATPGNWNHYRHGVIKGGPSIQFTNGSAQQQIAMTTGADWMRPDEQCANADFIAAANPAAVLALITEVEALKAERDYCRRVADHNLDLGVQYMNERDQAKTDNELLRAEINHLKQCPLYSTRMNSKRYLWLRDSHIGDDPESINLECGPNNGLDSAIDAAMSNKE